MLQSARQFSPEVRAKAAALFHIDARPSAEAVAARSPAAVAGLQVGDTLLAVNDQPLPGAGIDGDSGAASYGPVERANHAISQALGGGRRTPDFAAGRPNAHSHIEARSGLRLRRRGDLDRRLRASADGRHVFVTSALVSFARSDEALALILAHEYAHDLLRHHDRLARAGFARDILGDFGSSPASLLTAEKEADYVGLYLMARAGYDIASAPDIMRAFPDAAGDFDWSHPGVKARAASLAATRDEIMRKRASGEPLIPTPARCEIRRWVLGIRTQNNRPARARRLPKFRDERPRPLVAYGLAGVPLPLPVEKPQTAKPANRPANSRISSPGLPWKSLLVAESAPTRSPRFTTALSAAAWLAINIAPTATATRYFRILCTLVGGPSVLDTEDT